MVEVLLEKRSQGCKLGGGGMRDVTPPNKKIQILPERRPQNNCGIATNRNFPLKCNKFAKTLPVIDAQITGNDLCRAQDFKIFPEENSSGPRYKARSCISERSHHHKCTIEDTSKIFFESAPLKDLFLKYF